MNATVRWIGLTVTAVVLGVTVRSFTANSDVGAPAAMSPEIPRVQMEALPPAVMSARGFVRSEGRLMILDWRRFDVVVLDRDETGRWHAASRFGGRGDGPGELVTPVAIGLAADDQVVVLERSGELELFAIDGTHAGMVRYALPCVSARPDFTLVESRPLYAAECAGGVVPGLSADSMYMGLWQLDAAGPVLVTARSTMTMDGMGGSAYATIWPLTAHGRHTYLGTGLDGCAMIADAGAGGLEFREICGLTRGSYSALPPDGFEPPREEAAYRWPDPLQNYVALLESGDGTLLVVRPFHADSVVFETARSGKRVLIGPLSTLVECNSGGCLWYAEGMENDSIAFVPTERITGLARAASMP